MLIITCRCPYAGAIGRVIGVLAEGCYRLVEVYPRGSFRGVLEC